MINKHENISVGVYWNDVGVPGWKLSGWSNTRATISSKNCEKYSRNTLGVARYLRSYWDRRSDAGCCVLLRAPAQERPRKSEEPTPRCTNITIIIFPRIRKTANEEGLLYKLWCTSLWNFNINLHVTSSHLCSNIIVNTLMFLYALTFVLSC
jgi:hypothetical protein